MGQKDELGIVSGGMIFSTGTGPAPNGVGHFYCEPRRPSAAEKAGLEGCESDDRRKGPEFACAACLSPAQATLVADRNASHPRRHAIADHPDELLRRPLVV